MGKKLEGLRDALTVLRDEATELSERDEITPEEDARLDAVVAMAAEVRAAFDKEEAREAEIAEIRALELAGKTIETFTDRKALPVPGASDRNVFDLNELRVAAPDKFEGEARARALEAIETAPSHLMDDNAREAASKVISESRGKRAEELAIHVLRTGSPEYHEAFESYLRNPQAARAAFSLTGANGGFVVPFTLDPSLIVTNDGTTNPFRQISGQVSITTDDWNGVSTAGVSAEWLAEATEAADATPTFAQPSITVHKAAAWIFGSYEVLADAGLGSEVAGLIQDGKDRLESSAFATGSGSGQPYGIVTELGLVTASRVSASSGTGAAGNLVPTDCYNLDNDLGPRWRDNAVWVANKASYNTLRNAATNTGANNNAFWTEFGNGVPASLIGYPTYQSAAMDSTIVSGSNDDVLVLGDFKNGYKIVDRVGLELLYEPLVKGSNQRPTGQAGWFAFWRVGARAVVPSAFRMLRI